MIFWGGEGKITEQVGFLLRDHPLIVLLERVELRERERECVCESERERECEREGARGR